MFKKLFSGLTALVIAATLLPSVAFAGPGYGGAMTVSQSTFNPTNGESTQIHFFLYENASVYLYAVNQETSELYQITNGYESQNMGRVKYDWYGKSGRTALPNGDYKITLSISVDGYEVGYDTELVSLYGAASGGGTNKAPTVSNLNATPYSINPDLGESTTLSFYVEEDAWVDAYIKDSSGSVIRDFSQYENTWTDNSSTGTYHSVTWYGGNDGGYPLNDGTYYFYVDAYNNYGTDYKNWTSVQIKRPTVPKNPVVKSASASPSTINPDKGEYSGFNFSLANDGYVTAYVMDSYGNYVTGFSGYDGTTWYKNSSTGVNYALYWYGYNSNDKKVSDGTYYFYVSVSNGAASDYRKVKVSVDTYTSKTPQINDLNASPFTINPETGEYSTISFDLSEGAYVQVYIMKNSSVVRSFPAFDGDFYSANKSLYAYWDGKDSNGSYVNDGTYQVYVFAQASNGNYDTETTNVKVSKYSVPTPSIQNLYASPSTFDPENSQESKITFKVKEDAYISAYVKKGSTIYKTFNNYNNDFYNGSNASHTVWWNGRDDYGKIVDDGVYKFYVYTSFNGKSDSQTINVSVDTDDDPHYSNKVKNMKLSPSTTWDPTDEELDIDFTLKETVYDLKVTASKYGAKSVTIYNDPNYSYNSGGYFFEWNGRDKYGKYVESGTWKITVTADGDVVTKNVNLKYGSGDADIDAYVTKKEFDPAKGEVTNLLFKVDEDSEVDVEIYNSNTLEKVLWNNVDVNKNKWYSVEWDGKKSNGKYATYDKNWRFKITVDGADSFYSEDTKYVNANVKKDTASSKAANITKDYTLPVVFDDKAVSFMDISFCVDSTSDISLDIFKNTAGTGKKMATVIDDEKFKSGCHTVQWYVEDDNYNELNDGVYSYKLVSEATYGNKDTEVGVFVIGNAGNIVKKKKKPSNKCGGYWDLGNLSQDSEMCDAITWAQDEGIFSGYSDGSFRKEDTINRAEVLKVVLEAFKVQLLSSDGSKLGFSDVNPGAWYMTYLKTAKFHGMIEGYAGTNKVGMTDDINRVEMLKFVLEASDEFAGYESAAGYPYAYVYSDVTPSKWYYEYAVDSYKYGLFDSVVVGGKKYLKPSQLVRRGEVALLLYRMQKAGLL